MCLSLDINQLKSPKIELTINHHLKHFSTSYPHRIQSSEMWGADTPKYTLNKV